MYHSLRSQMYDVVTFFPKLKEEKQVGSGPLQKRFKSSLEWSYHQGLSGKVYVCINFQLTDLVPTMVKDTSAASRSPSPGVRRDDLPPINHLARQPHLLSRGVQTYTVASEQRTPTRSVEADGATAGPTGTFLFLCFLKSLQCGDQMPAVRKRRASMDQRATTGVGTLLSAPFWLLVQWVRRRPRRTQQPLGCWTCLCVCLRRGRTSTTTTTQRVALPRSSVITALSSAPLASRSRRTSHRVERAVASVTHACMLRFGRVWQVTHGSCAAGARARKEVCAPHGLPRLCLPAPPMCRSACPGYVSPESSRVTMGGWRPAPPMFCLRYEHVSVWPWRAAKRLGLFFGRFLWVLWFSAWICGLVCDFPRALLPAFGSCLLCCLCCSIWMDPWWFFQATDQTFLIIFLLFENNNNLSPSIYY